METILADLSTNRSRYSYSDFTQPDSTVMATRIVRRDESMDSHRAKLETAQREAARLDAHKHCGSLQLDEDPRQIQQRVRNEWKSAELTDAD